MRLNALIVAARLLTQIAIKGEEQCRASYKIFDMR